MIEKSTARSSYLTNLPLKKKVYYKMRQNFITKCGSFFIIKRDKNVLRNAAAFILQNALMLL